MGVKNLFSGNKKNQKKLQKKAKEVEAFASTMENKTDDELKDMTRQFRERLAKGESLDSMLAETFAVVREAARRVRGEYPYPVQIMGAYVLHNGDVAEMKTGEGKTLTATMAVYANALTGKGVHVVTVNEYLSHRDAQQMGLIYKFLGLTVGCNSAELSPAEKRAAYACDITYTTNSELGFDYLRDNMVFTPEHKVQRGLHYALVDEADSILIDEARTPLIISASGNDAIEDYTNADKKIKELTENDYQIFVKEKQIALTPHGIEKLQKMFHVPVLYSPENQKLLHKINKSLYANYILQKDVDYLVKDDEILLIDQFTGRVMVGHAYSEGLQQAIQAKEGVTIQPENKTSATITYQNFFRMYDKLAGMTGTAKTEEEEFLSIYNMYVTQIPTNRPVIREDKVDAIYRTKEIKFKNVVKEVKEAHDKKRPVLIGTADVETNEYVSELLDKAGISHETLNAKNHEREAEIIAKAGLPGAVTLATNMAGRGTDIKLTNESKKLGGLYVIGTERHESRRIDNQLRGRSGRQGDPGTSIFFVSLEDDLMKRYGGPTIERMFDKYIGEDRMESRSLSKSITNAQKAIEGINFDIRKQLIEFDDVLRKQREIYFERREAVVNAKTNEEIRKEADRYFEEMVHTAVNTFDKDIDGLCKYIHDTCQIVRLNKDLSRRTYDRSMRIFSVEELKEKKTNAKREAFILKRIGRYLDDLLLKGDPYYGYCMALSSRVMLKIMDALWIDHIDYMDKMRSAINLRSYAQKRPIDEYKDEGYKAFSNFIGECAFRISESLFSIRPALAVDVSQQ